MYVTEQCQHHQSHLEQFQQFHHLQHLCSAQPLIQTYALILTQHVQPYLQWKTKIHFRINVIRNKKNFSSIDNRIKGIDLFSIALNLLVWLKFSIFHEKAKPIIILKCSAQNYFNFSMEMLYFSTKSYKVSKKCQEGNLIRLGEQLCPRTCAACCKTRKFNCRNGGFSKIFFD